MYKWYLQWPEWLRWVLFLPISFLFAGLGVLVAFGAGSLAGAYTFVSEVMGPIVFFSLFLLVLYKTTPRKKAAITIVALVVLGAIYLFEVGIFFAELIILDRISDNMTWKDTIGTLLAVASGIFVTVSCVRENKKPTPTPHQSGPDTGQTP